MCKHVCCDSDNKRERKNTSPAVEIDEKATSKWAEHSGYRTDRVPGTQHVSTAFNRRMMHDYRHGKWINAGRAHSLNRPGDENGFERLNNKK